MIFVKKEIKPRTPLKWLYFYARTGVFELPSQAGISQVCSPYGLPENAVGEMIKN